MKERIVQKISKIRGYHALITGMKEDCENKFVTGTIYRGALLHYLYLIADTCITLAELLIKQKGLRPPQSYHEAFDILGEARILRPDFAYSFANIAGFRNFLAHDYEHVEAITICRNMLDRLGEVEVFCGQAEGTLTE